MNISDNLYKALKSGYEPLKNEKILVALSGGKDSCFLLYTLVDILGGKNISACYVNHNIRETSSIEKDITVCQKICSLLNIPFTIKSVAVLDEVKNSKNSIESSARNLRYKALKDCYDETNSSVLLTAHTENDTIESFFVDVMTGSSIFTLGGILHRTHMFGMNIHRPLLEIQTSEILTLLEANSIEFIKDETNDDESYTRNFVRHNIAPYFDNYKNSILRLQKESQELNNLFNSFEKDIIKTVGEDFFIINKQGFKTLQPLQQQFILGKYMNYFFRAGKKHTQNVMKILSSKSGRRINLPDGFICEISYKYISIYHNSYISPFYVEKKAEEQEIFLINDLIHIEFFGDLLYNSLVVRNRRNGDTVGNKKLKDIFINNKIESIIRDMTIIVESCDGIIFVENIFDNKNIRITRKDKEVWNNYTK